MVGAIMADGKIQAPIVLVITFLLAFGLFVTVNVINNSNTMAGQSSINDLQGNETEVFLPKSVFINELMADNDRAVESVFGGHPDWFELYNSANQSVDLSGLYFSDSLTIGTWRVPNGTIIQANSYLIVWADADAGQAQLQTNFNLKANGGVVALFAEDRKTIFDFVLYDKQIRDVSYGRLPDGGLSWDYMTIPTAGKQNVANPRSTAPIPVEIWLILILVLAILTFVALKGKIHLRRKA